MVRPSSPHPSCDGAQARSGCSMPSTSRWPLPLPGSTSSAAGGTIAFTITSHGAFLVRALRPVPTFFPSPHPLQDDRCMSAFAAPLHLPAHLTLPARTRPPAHRSADREPASSISARMTTTDSLCPAWPGRRHIDFALVRPPPRPPRLPALTARPLASFFAHRVYVCTSPRPPEPVISPTPHV